MTSKLEKVLNHVRAVATCQIRISKSMIDAMPFMIDSPEKELLRESCLESQRECASLLEELEPQTT